MEPTAYAGMLEVKQTYVLTGQHSPATGVSIFDALKPPRLRIPMHHAARVEWVGGEDPKVPDGLVRLTFVVEAHDVTRVDARRWNSTRRLRLLDVTSPQVR